MRDFAFLVYCLGNPICISHLECITIWITHFRYSQMVCSQRGCKPVLKQLSWAPSCLPGPSLSSAEKTRTLAQGLLAAFEICGSAVPTAFWEPCLPKGLVQRKAKQAAQTWTQEVSCKSHMWPATRIHEAGSCQSGQPQDKTAATATEACPFGEN